MQPYDIGKGKINGRRVYKANRRYSAENIKCMNRLKKTTYKQGTKQQKQIQDKKSCGGKITEKKPFE